jgi:hypothetical protein
MCNPGREDNRRKDIGWDDGNMNREGINLYDQTYET